MVLPLALRLGATAYKAYKKAQRAGKKTSSSPTKKQTDATKKRNREIEEKQREKSSVEMRTKILKSTNKRQKERGDKPYDPYHEKVKESAGSRKPFKVEQYGTTTGNLPSKK
jgi:hypothetical protein